MLTLRRDGQRRRIRRGQHDAWRTFYPPDPQDPGADADSFGALFRLTEVRLAPGGGTRSRPDDEAEIVTYVHQGALAHRDSTGSSCVIHAGEFQRMTVSRPVRHQVTNASRTDRAHVFLIALRPARARPARAHEHKRFTIAQRHNVLCVVASPDGRKGSLLLDQEALIYSSILDTGHHLVHELLPGRGAWLHIVTGEAKLHDIVLTRGDGVGITFEPSVSLTVQQTAEILLVDLSPAPNSLDSSGA